MNEKKTLSLSELLRSIDEPVSEVSIEGLDKPIKIYKLTNKDLLFMDESKSDLERSYRLLYCILQRNIPGLKYEDVLNMPADLSTKLTNSIMKEARHFLPTVQRSKEPLTTQPLSESISSQESTGTNQAK